MEKQMENDVLTAGDLADELAGPIDNEQTGEDSQNDGDGQEHQQEEGQDGVAEGDESDGEEGDGQEEQSDDQKSSEVFLEWESNGEKIRVSQDELKNGYMRQQDYTQKTQNLARDSQALQQRVQQEFQAVQALATEYGQLTQIDAQLEQFKQVDWNTLKQQDPLAYNTYLAEMSNLKNIRGEVVQQIEGKRHYMTQQQAQAFQQATAEAQEHLKKVIPNYGPDVLKTMKTYAEKMGFTAQELAQVSDKRSLQVLYEAAQWRALQEKKPALQNKMKNLPTKATKPAGNAPPAKQVQIEKQTKRLAQTGKVGDFAALLNSLK
jgi:hypothetical protein